MSDRYGLTSSVSERFADAIAIVSWMLDMQLHVVQGKQHTDKLFTTACKREQLYLKASVESLNSHQRRSLSLCQ